MSYTETMKILTRDCDMNGRWKPSAIMESMQEVAIAHCDSIGLSRAVTDGLGVAWVLSRCRVELGRVPASGEHVSLETYAMPMKHLFFPRVHLFRDARKNVIGRAYGLWLLLNMTTRRAAANPFVTQTLPLEDRPAPTAAPGTVRPLNESPTVAALSPQFTDFDLNGHVNNARYLDWCWNALGFEALRGREIAAFDVNYDREILPGEAVTTSLCLEENDFSFCGFEGERRCFGIRGTLRELS